MIDPAVILACGWLPWFLSHDDVMSVSDRSVGAKLGFFLTMYLVEFYVAKMSRILFFFFNDSSRKCSSFPSIIIHLGRVGRRQNVAIVRLIARTTDDATTKPTDTRGLTCVTSTLVRGNGPKKTDERRKCETFADVLRNVPKRNGHTFLRWRRDWRVTRQFIHTVSLSPLHTWRLFGSGGCSLLPVSIALQP